jgi:delta14-sterol reductase
LKQEVGWPEEGFSGLVSWKASLAMLGYFLLSGVLYRVLPAHELNGTELRSGGSLKYRLNSK